jgi:hypothetical protein
MRTLLLRAFIAIISVGIVRVSFAQDQTPRRHYFVLHPHAQGTLSPGNSRCLPHTDERAGYPRGLSEHLEPSTTPGGILDSFIMKIPLSRHPRGHRPKVM